jgi:endoglucanase
MDWLVGNTDTGVVPSPPPSVMATLPSDQTPPMPLGSYDAIRVYLWAGIADPKTPHLAQELAALRGMGGYLSKNPVPPLSVGPEGQIVNPNGPVGFSAAVIPYLHLLGSKSEAVQSDRLKAALDPATGLYGHDGMYYDQNLAMFAEGWSTGRFSFDSHGQLRLKWKS